MNNLAEEKELEPENYIVGKVDLGDYYWHRPISIIHRLRRRDQLNNGEKNDPDYTEIEDKIKISIDGRPIDFSYDYEFKEAGEHTILYSFQQNLTDVNCLFCGCSSFTSFNLSKFDTQNVQNMSSMFENCKSLKELNLSNLNTKNVIDMSSMFKGCKSLEELNLSNLDTQNVKNMSSMFEGCESLKKLEHKKTRT